MKTSPRTTSLPTIRQSHLRHLEEHCPAMAWALSVEGREGPGGPGAVRGQALHSFFARYVEHLAAVGATRDPQALPGLLGTVLADYPSLTLRQRADVEEQAVRLVSVFRLDLAHFWGVEVPLHLAVPLDDGGEAQLRGRLDFLAVDERAGRAHILDLKSSYHLPPDTQVREDLQLAVYALLVLANFPQVDVVTGNLLFTRYGVMLPRDDTAGLTRDDARQLEAHLGPRLSAHFSGRLRSEFRPGPHCSYCPRRRPGDCPLFRSYQGLTPPAPQSERQARRLARQIIALEEARKCRLALLKAYVDERGPLQVGSGRQAEVFSYERRESEEIPATEFLRILAAYQDVLPQVDLSRVLRVDRTSTEFRQLRSHPRLKAELDRVAEPQISARTFGHRRTQG